MAFAYTGAHGSGSGASGVSTNALDSSLADLIIVAVGFATSNPGSVSDNKSNTWVPLTSRATTSGSVRIHYSIPSTVGSGHTFAFGGGFAAMAAACFSGANASQSPSEAWNATASGTTLQATVAIGANTNLVISAFENPANGATQSIDSSFTKTDDVAGVSGTSYGLALAFKIVTGSESPTWTGSVSSELVLANAAFAAAGGGSAFLARPPVFVKQAVNRASTY